MGLHLINKSRKTFERKGVVIYNENGEEIIDPNAIRKEWYEYFKNLYAKPVKKRGDVEFESKIKHDIKQFYHDTRGDRSTSKLNYTFKMVEMLTCNKHLKTRKANGWDRISAENIINGGPFLQKCLLVLYNAIVTTEKIPIEMKRGVIVTVPKDNQDSRIKSNNRGITLLTVFYKQFQNLIRLRYEKEMNNCIDEVQGAGKNTYHV